jgi:hypothetical protein
MLQQDGREKKQQNREKKDFIEDPQVHKSVDSTFGGLELQTFLFL